MPLSNQIRAIEINRNQTLPGNWIVKKHANMAMFLLKAMTQCLKKWVNYEFAFPIIHKISSLVGKVLEKHESVFLPWNTLSLCNLRPVMHNIVSSYCKFSWWMQKNKVQTVWGKTLGVSHAAVANSVALSSTWGNSNSPAWKTDVMQLTKELWCSDITATAAHPPFSLTIPGDHTH